MTDCKELQALGAITSEVDESLVKITLSNQCIKAQVFLIDRLRKESARQQGLCKNASSDNFKVEAEIKHAELELKSMMTALETLRSANIEMKKELLLAKERKQTTLQRVESGEKKYEALWNQCKKRYESIPFVQKWFAVSNTTQQLTDQIQKLGKETVELNSERRTKISMMQELDRKRIIDMAAFMVERPKIIKTIYEKKAASAKLTEKINNKLKERECIDKTMTPLKIPQKEASCIMLVDGDWPSLRETFTTDDRDDSMIPRLHFANDDLNSFRANLDQLKKLSIPQIPSGETKKQKDEIRTNSAKTEKKDDNGDMSSFYKTYLTSTRDNSGLVAEREAEIASSKKKKLIQILEDISIEDHDARNMVAAANPDEMHSVNAIGEKEKHDYKAATSYIDQTQNTQHQLFGTPSEVLLPPTPFSDSSKKRGLSQKTAEEETKQDCKIGSQKKHVSFELPTIEEVDEDNGLATEDDITDKADQLNLSAVSTESYNKMKEMLLKKHNLDLSPDFVYAKKTMKLEEKIVTSKFFKNNKTINENYPKHESQVLEVNEQMEEENTDKIKGQEDVVDDDGIEEVIDSSAKNDIMNDKKERTSGFLFTHGPSGLPESLDISINTTGFEDGDGDFSHCIDTSLLLSPKADMNMPAASDNAVNTQVPNFLSGLRKTGFSFFGGPGPDDNPEANASQGSNFNFNFGGDNKNRGGLFSMFR